MKAVANMNSGFRTSVQIGPHTLVSDEPVDKGGSAQGPTAYSLLGGALSACTAATLRFYANLKQMPLEGVEVEAEVVRRTPAEQVEAGPTAKGAWLRKKITLKGDKLTPEQRDRLLAVADKCPVYRTLMEGVDVLHQD